MLPRTQLLRLLLILKMKIIISSVIFICFVFCLFVLNDLNSENKCGKVDRSLCAKVFNGKTTIHSFPLIQFGLWSRVGWSFSPSFLSLSSPVFPLLSGGDGPHSFPLLIRHACYYFTSSQGPIWARFFLVRWSSPSVEITHLQSWAGPFLKKEEVVTCLTKVTSLSAL